MLWSFNPPLRHCFVWIILFEEHKDQSCLCLHATIQWILIPIFQPTVMISAVTCNHRTYCTCCQQTEPAVSCKLTAKTTVKCSIPTNGSTAYIRTSWHSSLLHYHYVAPVLDDIKMTGDYIAEVLRKKWRYCSWAVTAFAALQELEPETSQDSKALKAMCAWVCKDVCLPFHQVLRITRWAMVHRQAPGRWLNWMSMTTWWSIAGGHMMPNGTQRMHE